MSIPMVSLSGRSGSRGTGPSPLADVRSGDLTESSRFAVTSEQVAAVMRHVRAATECGWGSRNGCPSCWQELAERMVNGRTFALGCHQCSGRVGPSGARRACGRLDGLSDRGGVSMGDPPVMEPPDIPGRFSSHHPGCLSTSRLSLRAKGYQGCCCCIAVNLLYCC